MAVKKKIKEIKQLNSKKEYDAVSIGCDAKNVDLLNGSNLEDALKGVAKNYTVNTFEEAQENLDAGLYEEGSIVFVKETTPPYKIMTVNIDLTDSDPETCCSYADDAIDMIAKSKKWDNFFGHYPVLFKDGAEIGKLNPSDFTKFKDGSEADITSGETGDVMIAFPRLGLKIETNEDILTISMTNNPNNSEFKYYAHTKGEVQKDKFYLGAYKGYIDNSKLRSLSGYLPSNNKTITEFRTCAQANGEGYEQSGFYQLVFRQAMYILKYKNLNSQKALGNGNLAGKTILSTGETDSKGMDYGLINDMTSHMKLFGLEDFWGNIWEWIDGAFTDSSLNLFTSTNNIYNSNDEYINQKQLSTSNFQGYINKVQGTTETGFLAKEVEGSTTTYFCDYGNIQKSTYSIYGGDYNAGYGGGVFRINITNTSSSAMSNLGARLMFL